MNTKSNYNLPIKLDRSDYEGCVELVRVDASNNPTISSVYLMGGEWVPGISDLDIVVVYKDGVTPNLLREPWGLSDKAKLIFTHRYLSFSESAFKYFYSLYPKETTNLRLIVGRESQPLPISENSRQWVLAFILFDVLINKLLLFTKADKLPKNIRQLIGELYSLVYDIWIIKEISGIDIGHGFGERIQKLRQDWFSLDEVVALEKLAALQEEGVLLVADFVSALNNFVSNKIQVNNYVTFSNDKYSIKFVRGWSHEKFVEEFDKSLINKKVKSFRLLLPQSLAIFLQAYAQGEGKFSELIHQNLRGAKENGIPESLNEHVRAVNMAYEASITSGGIFKIPYSYGFVSGKRGFRSKILWWVATFLRDI